VRDRHRLFAKILDVRTFGAFKAMAGKRNTNHARRLEHVTTAVRAHDWFVSRLEFLRGMVFDRFNTRRDSAFNIIKRRSHTTKVIWMVEVSIEKIAAQLGVIQVFKRTFCLFKFGVSESYLVANNVRLQSIGRSVILQPFTAQLIFRGVMIGNFPRSPTIHLQITYKFMTDQANRCFSIIL
jgi:hypothetical protein